MRPHWTRGASLLTSNSGFVNLYLNKAMLTSRGSGMYEYFGRELEAFPVASKIMSQPKYFVNKAGRGDFCRGREVEVPVILEVGAGADLQRSGRDWELGRVGTRFCFSESAVSPYLYCKT